MSDKEISKLIRKEKNRLQNTINLIPSENYTSLEVRKAIGSILINKYSEGYPERRYYNGNKYIDEIEKLAISRAKALFSVPHANVQPYSGSPANSAVYFALLSPGDIIMGLKLSGGGHLTHGHPVTFSGKYFRSVQYDVEENGMIDMKKVKELAQKEKPKLIIVGTTAYPRILNFSEWKEIADSVGAYLLADISHIAGLVIAGVHPSPAKFADIIMTTTHKTLRGPRGAILMVTNKGLEKDPLLAEKIDKAVFPGLQGGPHNNTTAGIAIALEEASTNEYKDYCKQIISNSKTLSNALLEEGLTLVTGGTDNHLMLIDLRPLKITGKVVADALEKAGIIVNRNSIPHDSASPFNPSGIRLGTPAVTTRGMKEPEMKKLAKIISAIIKNPNLAESMKPDVAELCKQFPLI